MKLLEPFQNELQENFETKLQEEFFSSGVRGGVPSKTPREVQGAAQKELPRPTQKEA